ncbi:hypothetical protein ACJX0J_033427, partial [Zea mays]
METLLKASAYILGATSSSIVYKVMLADGTALAVRRIGESGGTEKLKDFEAQGANEKLLIHDYAPNGSIANIAFRILRLAVVDTKAGFPLFLVS